MKLYRPVGLKELELISQLQFEAFPPRLEIQPIFYPVLNYEYAAQIAREWNTKDPISGYIGFVTEFDAEDTYVSRFEIQVVGGATVHRELWVPSEVLDEFNRHIVGGIKIIDSFTGENYGGTIDPETHLPVGLIR